MASLILLSEVSWSFKTSGLVLIGQYMQKNTDMKIYSSLSLN